VWAVILVCFGASPSVFAGATIEVGTATLPALAAPASTATPTPFTTISFITPFAEPPNVFPQTPEFGAGADNDPCVIRIRNVTATGFDATCLEPINEDRATPGTVFEYIAIQDGGVTVPLDDGTGSVEFRSACVNTNVQVFGPNCDNCSGAQAFISVPFTPAFAAAPALLTQIQTTNNSPGGEPIFIEAAVQSGSLSAGGVNLSLDQLEAGNGPIASTEEICYLAVERDGCQELDFSSLDGPTTAVTFNAVFAGNIDGHDNGCSAGEGATFAPGCFTQTPIAIEDLSARNGNNGGFLRRCDINADEIILTVDEDRVSDGERNHIDEPASVLAFSSVFSTPVTLNRMRISQRGRRVGFDWETSAETFHLGFNLWGEQNGEWIQLNRELIAGAGVDTSGVKSYRNRVHLSRDQANTIQRFGISSIDNTGFEEFYGPFVVGQEYGEQANNEAVDWTATRESFDQSMAERGFVKTNNRWRPASARRLEHNRQRELGVGIASFALRPEQVGIQSISAQTLLDLNPAWQGASLRRVALTLNGDSVPRHIISDDQSLSADDRIVFYAKTPTDTDGLYLENYTYQLRLDRQRVVNASQFDGSVNVGDALVEQTLMSKTLTSKQQHSSFLTNGDPYFDSQISSFGNLAETQYDFDFEQNIVADGVGSLAVELVGGINFPGDDPDHHVQITLNGVTVLDESFDGLETLTNITDLPAGLLKQTGNELRIILPGDTGYFADRIIVDTVSVAATVPLNSQNSYEFDYVSDVNAYQLELAGSDQAEVYAYTNTGALSVIRPDIDESGLLRFKVLPFEPNQARGETLSYAVATSESWLQLDDISVLRAQVLHRDAADYLVVAHPSFIGEKLSEFIELKASQDFNPRVIDWLEIVDTYGYGNDTPQALDNFLSNAQREFEFSNVLLVGGQTYDSFDINDQGIVNFIPAHYRRVGIFQFAPTDNPYADLDNDNIPDVAIGRWPVRDAQDLASVIDKTKAWHQNRNDEIYQEALLIAQPNDQRDLNFSQQIDGRVGIPLAELAEFNEIEKLTIQDVIDSGVEDPVAATRERIRTAINDGTDLISFSGHGSTAAWGFQGIVNTEFVKSLDNSGQPAIVMPLACYTTYYENPSVNSLAHQWLFAGDTGAVAVHGASVLGEYRENAVFAERYLRQSKDATTIGQAIMNAKRAMSSHNSMLHNWALLGDPALPLR